jgi:hypothetical protein
MQDAEAAIEDNWGVRRSSGPTVAAASVEAQAGVSEVEAEVRFESLDGCPNGLVWDVLGVTAFRASEVVMAVVGDFVLASVGAELGADEESVIGESV